jgi:hypothetical protein
LSASAKRDVCECFSALTGERLGTVPYDTPYTVHGPPPLSLTWTKAKPFTDTSFGGLCQTRDVCTLNVSLAGAKPKTMQMSPAMHTACAAPDDDAAALDACLAGKRRMEADGHTRILHCGKCAACSDLDDLEVLWRTRETQAVTIGSCTTSAFAEGRQSVGDFKACLASSGFDLSQDGRAWEEPLHKTTCMDAWVDDFLHSYSVCDSEVWCTYGTNGSTISTNTCTQCDEYRSGPIFIRGAGADRRSSGIYRADVDDDDLVGTQWELKLCKVGYYSGATYADAARDSASIVTASEALDQHLGGDEYTTMSAASEHTLYATIVATITRVTAAQMPSGTPYVIILPRVLYDDANGTTGLSLVEMPDDLPHATTYTTTFVAIFAALLAWDLIAYWILGFSPPFRQLPADASADATGDAPPQVEETGDRDTVKHAGGDKEIVKGGEKPAVDSTGSDGSEKKQPSAVNADEVEEVDFEKKRPLLLMLAAMCFAADCGYGIIISYLPQLLLSKGSEQAAAGFVVGSFAVGQILGSVCTPFILRRVPALNITRMTTLIIGFASACFGLVIRVSDTGSLVPLMCACRFVIGIGMGANETANQSMIYRMVTPQQLTRVRTAHPTMAPSFASLY